MKSVKHMVWWEFFDEEYDSIIEHCDANLWAVIRKSIQIPNQPITDARFSIQEKIREEISQ